MKSVVGKWLVHPSENKITHVETEMSIKLEPRAMEVLHYFAQKPAQVISRDELIEHIWEGRIVGDHAIYRVINQIRKALDPNAKDTYLTTIAKKGYKLIQPVEVYQASNFGLNENISSEEAVLTKNSTGENLKLNETSSTLKLLMLLSFMALSVYVLWKIVLEAKWDYYLTPLYTEIKPFNPEDSFEDYPSYSANGKYIIYSKKNASEANFDLYVKNLDTSGTVKITDGTIDWIKSVISNNANVIVAIGRQGEKCTVFLLRKINSESYNEKELFACDENPYIDIDLDSAGRMLYFTYKDNQNSISRIFSYKIKTGKREQITNVYEGKYGDHLIALSPDDNQLAFVRSTENDKSIIGIYDLEKRNLKLLSRFNKWLYSLSWSASGQDLIYQAGAKIHKYSVKNNYTKPILSSPTRFIRTKHSPVNAELSIVKRESQFAVWRIQNPFYSERSLESESSLEQIMFSDTLEYYPHYANLSNKIAFVSKRSGSQQIWIRNESGDYKQLTDFSDARLIHYLSWSPDDKYIVSNTNSDGYIYLIDSDTGESRNLVSQNEYPKAMNPTWSVDGKILYFCAEFEGDFNAYQYRIDTNEIKKLTEDGVGWYKELDKDNYLFIKSNETGLRISTKGRERLLIRNISLAQSSQLNINKATNSIYYVDFKDKKLYQLNIDDWSSSESVIPVFPGPTSNLSVSNDGQKIVFADIFRRKSKIYSVTPQ